MTMPYGAPGAGDEAYRHWLRSQGAADAARDALLASDTERDHVCRRLASAFSEGRITSAELDERTSQALAARTHGDLDAVLRGLTVPVVPAPPVPLAPLGYAPPAAPAPRSVNPRMVRRPPRSTLAPSPTLVRSAQGPSGLVPVMVLGPILYLVYRRLYPRT